MVFKGTEMSGPAIDKGLADVVNEGLRSVGQSEEVKKTAGEIYQTIQRR